MVNLTSRWERAGAVLRYADNGGTGTGTPVILTHGAGMDHTMFTRQADALTHAGYRTILWDLRGHGASHLTGSTRFTAADALADLAGLIDELRLERPVLVGHSLGGNLAQAYVRAHPRGAGGLVVVDSTWNTGPLSGLDRLGLRLAAPALRLIPASRLPALMAGASAVTPDAVRQIEAVFARMPKRVFLDVWRATVSLVDPDPGYRIPVPLGLIRGARDSTGNIATAMPRWAAAEGVAEHVIADAGHVVTLDAPEAASETLLTLIDRMVGAEGAR